MSNLKVPMKTFKWNNEFYKNKLGASGTSVIKFYKKYLNESKSFPNLIDHAKKVYLYARKYTNMNSSFFIKSKIRSKLTDGHLDPLLRLACSDIQADIENLSAQKQHQKSH